MQVFQVVPPVVRDVGNGFEIDEDFAHGLKIYLDVFDSFSVACPVYTQDKAGSGLQQCVPIRDLPFGPDRFKFTPLPVAYHPRDFLSFYPRVRRFLRAEVADADYLIVTPHALIGDWPTVAIREAIKLGKSYTIEADAVQGVLMRSTAAKGSGWKRLVRSRVLSPIFDRVHRYGLRNSSLGVFQGQDVFAAYAPYCSNPHKLNHHVPIQAGDHITDDQLAAKLASITAGEPLRLTYAGRAIEWKGPLEWIETLHLLARNNIRFEATWLGDGPMLAPMQAHAAKLGVPNVTFTGLIADRKVVLEELKKAHIFLFCHNILESARVLGEALACGAPLVGFETSYPVDLVAQHGGGLFCPIGEVTSLAGLVSRLDSDRVALSDLVRAAARSGAGFNRDDALRERAQLVRKVGF